MTALLSKVIIAIFGFVLVLLGLTYENITPPWSYVLIASGSLVLIATIAQAIREHHDSRYNSDTGVLQPLRRHYSKDLDGKEDGLTIRLGTSGSYLNWEGHVLDPKPDLTIPQKLFLSLDDNAYYNGYIWFNQGLLRIRINVYDQSLNLIGQVDGNRWWVNRALGCQINFDKEAAEIVNPQGRVQFQIVMYLNVIQLAYFSYSPIGGWANINGNMERFPLNELPSHEIRPLFRYPASAHPGKRMQ